MPQRDQGFTVAAGDGGIGDLEGVRFDAPAVVPLHGDFGDLAGGIGDELLAGRRQLGEVVAECGDEGAQRAGGDAFAAAAKLRHGKIVLVGVFFQFGADDFDAVALTRADAVEQSFAAHSPGVTQHHVGVVGRVLQVVDGFIQERVAAFLDAADPDHAGFPEQ